MKVIERISEKQLRNAVNLGEMQMGFMLGTETVDEMFIM